MARHRSLATALTATLALGVLTLTALAPHAVAADPQPVKLQLTDEGIRDATLKDLGDGSYEIVTTGKDPAIQTAPFASPVDLAQTPLLAFEYFTLTPTDSMQVFFVPPGDEPHSVSGEGLGHSEGWVSHTLNLGEDFEQLPAGCQRLRIDFGTRAGRTIRLRNPMLRAPTAREKELAANAVAKQAAEKQLEAELRAYLDTDFPNRITQVTVDDQSITIQGELAEADGARFLTESPLDRNITGQTTFEFLMPLTGSGPFTLTVDRFIPQGDHQYDRLLSRWAVVRQEGDGYRLASHGRYADTVKPLYDLPLETPRTKKGLGGFSVGKAPESDLDDLGISSITVNVRLYFMRKGPGEGVIPFQYCGKTYYADRQKIEELDQTFQAAARRNIVVLAIILVPKANQFPEPEIGRFFEHPDCDPSGIFSMANVTSPEGLEYYAAALDFLASRYSRPDNQYGRIHHWIMHNEVDAGWVWTNAGRKTPLVYMDLYHKSMRTAHLIARKYNSHAKPFISLTHYWAWTSNPRFYLSRDLLGMLVDFSHAEGDFEWAVAHHPYPESLFEPRTWEDKKVDWTLDSQLITYRNLEVLGMWAAQPATFFQGRTPRSIHLTEQGLNSRDYGEKALTDQAAGMAYAWKKMAAVPAIEAFQYHNWVDSRGEGGLRIGLRRFRDDEQDPLGRKPIWFLYQKLDTPEEDAACAPYLKWIGLKSWDEIIHKGE